uniref:Ig-like domain-containing protein n=1 Tax=Macrostomum lignano TaxID=282301 RepID=A0A1I8F2P2_9PLAT
VNPIVSVRQLQPVRPPRQGESVRLLCNVEASEEPQQRLTDPPTCPTLSLQPVDQSLYAIVGRELAIRNLSYATLGLYHCYAEMQPGDKLFSREPRPVLPEGQSLSTPRVSSADEAAASDLVELKAEFPASFAVTWYRFTDIGLEPSKEPIAATDPNVQRVGNNLLLRAGSWRRFATRMNLLGGRVTFGYFFMCHGSTWQQNGWATIGAPAFRAGQFRAPAVPSSNRPSRQRFCSARLPETSLVTRSLRTPPPPAGRRCPRRLERTPAESPWQADGSLSNSRLSAGRASAQLHLLVSTPPLLSKVNQTIAANESSGALHRLPAAGRLRQPPPATEFSWYRLDPGGGNPSLVATSGTAGADSSGSSHTAAAAQQASVHAENGRLIIHNLSVDASGQYVCLGRHPPDKEFARNTSGTVRLRSSRRCGLCPNLANTVFVELKTQHVIDCPWSGLEQPSIAWYRLYPNGRRRRLPTSPGDSHQALLHRGGRRRCSTLISSEPHGDPGAPRCGCNCRASGSPPPLISWTLRRPAQERGRHLRPHELGRCERQPEGRCCSRNGSLLINRMSQMDAGNYHCLGWHAIQSRP